MKSIKWLALLMLVFVSVSAAAGAVRVEVRADSITGPLAGINNGVMGDMSLLLTIEGRKLMAEAGRALQEPRYRRTMGELNTSHGFPDGTNVYHEDSSGTPFYDFTVFDQVYDAITEEGMTPFICLGFMPLALSSAPPDSLRQSWQHPERYPPENYDKWHGLVRAVASHCVERYGRDKVLRWKWEVWNEPDLSFFWQGSRDEYFRLYDYTAAAIKEILPEALVGGNAVAGAESSFLDEFIGHCVSGNNSYTGGRGAPLDFISFHMKGGGSRFEGNLTSPDLLRRANVKPRDPNFRGMLERTEDALRRIGRIEGTAGIPVYISECDVDFGVSSSIYEDPNAVYRNNEYFPAFQCALVAEMLELARRYPANPVVSLNMDTFFFPGFRIFEGQRTLFTAGGIRKPIYNALEVLRMLGGQRLAVETSPGATEALGVLSTVSNESEIAVLLYNFDQRQAYADTVPVELDITGLGAAEYTLTHWRIDREHSNSYRAWQRLGAPLHPTDNQLAQIREAMALQRLEPDKRVRAGNGGLKLDVTLPPHSVTLLVMRPQ